MCAELAIAQVTFDR